MVEALALEVGDSWDGLGAEGRFLKSLQTPKSPDEEKANWYGHAVSHRDANHLYQKMTTIKGPGVTDPIERRCN